VLRRQAVVIFVITVGLAHLSGCNHPAKQAVRPIRSLLVADPHRSSWRRLALDAGTIDAAAWSPDGRYVVVETSPASEVASSTAKDNEAQITRADMIDTQSGTTITLPVEVHAPFAWMLDGGSFAACTRAPEGNENGITWFGLDGKRRRSVELTQKLLGIESIAAEGSSGEVAVVADEQVGDDASTGIYRSEKDGLKLIDERPDIFGLSWTDQQTGGGPGLYWTTATVSGHSVHLELYKLSQGSKTVESEPLLDEKGLVYNDGPDYSLTVSEVVIAPTTERVSITLLSSKNVQAGDVTPNVRQACFVVETAEPALHLIMETESNGGELTVSWSADASKLVVEEMLPTAPEMFVFNYDGANKRVIPKP